MERRRHSTIRISYLGTKHLKNSFSNLLMKTFYEMQNLMLKLLAYIAKGK